MVNSHKFKRERAKARRGRAKIRNRKCKVCGKNLTNTIHHYLCNDHWKLRQAEINKLNESGERKWQFKRLSWTFKSRQ